MGRFVGALQTTLASEIELTGTGVHSGAPVSITLCPSAAGTGIRFLVSSDRATPNGTITNGTPSVGTPTVGTKSRLSRDAGTPKQAAPIAKPVSMEQSGDDLEIPAFLRRQAN